MRLTDEKRVIEILASSPDPVPIIGPPGTGVLFHCNILHSSGHNLSARDRWQVYYAFNTVANKPHDVENPRPDYVRSTNLEPDGGRRWDPPPLRRPRLTTAALSCPKRRARSSKTRPRSSLGSTVGE